MTQLVPHEGNPLAEIEDARTMLERSRDLSEVSKIRSIAIAALAYAKAEKLGREAVAYAQEIINRAGRRQGELLRDQPPEYPNPRGRAFTSAKEANVNTIVPTVRQQIGYKVSQRSQDLADVPKHIFERHVSKAHTRLLRCARQDLLAERRDEAVAPVTVLGDIEIRHCSITDLDIEPGTVDLIIADPVYTEPEGYSNLGAFAAKALKPGCPLLAYTGELVLPDLVQRLGEHLDYTWTLKIIWAGANNKIFPLQMFQDVKLILMYSNGKYEPKRWLHDTMHSSGSGMKEHHPWQQFLEPVKKMVEMFTEPGDLVVDPFLGSGTTAVACKELGRRFIGCDIDAGVIATARERTA